MSNARMTGGAGASSKTLPAGSVFSRSPGGRLIAGKGLLAISVFLFAGVATLAGNRSGSTLHETFGDFQEGEFEKVSMSRDGTLRLAPGAELVAELDEPIVWSAALGLDGEIYVGTGKQGKVFRVSAEGESEVVFDADEVLVRALAVGPDGALYAGTSPDGRVYRVAPDQEGENEHEPEIFFDPDTAYIWDLLFDEEGNLLVATGDKGKVYQIPPDGTGDGEAEVYFESGEAHVSVLAWDKDGRLLAGTSPEGYLYRVDENGRAFVLFNSPDEEVRRIQPGDEGEIFVSTFSGQDPGGRSSPAYISDAMSVIEEAIGQEGDGGSGGDGNRASSGDSGNGRVGAIYRIEEDGFWESYWDLPRIAVHSLLVRADGTVLAGSGVEAGLFSIDGSRDWRLRQRLDSGSQVSELLGDDNEVWALTSNPARIFRLQEESVNTGAYKAKVFDAEQVAHWGRLYVDNTSGDGDGVAVFTRSGNTDDPDDFWSDWAPLGENSAIASPAARYLQYRLDLDGSANVSPAVRRVRFFHHYRNVAPEITDIRVVTESIGLRRFESPPQQPRVDLDRLFRENRDRPRRGGGDERSQVRAYERPGTITIAWRANDRNGDDLEFTVKARRAGEEDWMVLADEVRDTFHSFESTGFDDGLYQAKVIANDRRSNSRGEQLTGRRESELFLIDNAPPELVLDEAVVDGDTARIRFRARDEVSLIAAAAYSLNGGDSIRIFPSDGLFDAREETFEIEIDDLRPGRNDVFIRAADEARNISVLNVSLQAE